jgi:flagellar basal body-associated protein FliL
MSQNKQQDKPKDQKSAFIIIGLGILVFAISRYPMFFLIGAGVILGILIFSYIKLPRFHAYINGKFVKKSKVNGIATAQPRQNNGTNPSCPICNGLLIPIANLPKFYYCNNCQRVTDKI